MKKEKKIISFSFSNLSRIRPILTYSILTYIFISSNFKNCILHVALVEKFFTPVKFKEDFSIKFYKKKKRKERSKKRFFYT